MADNSYAVSEYYATGEGYTVCIMIMPGVYTLDALKGHFSAEFGDWYTVGMQVLAKTEFLSEWGEYIPEHIQILINRDCKMFNYTSQFHINLS
jgi:hypothetical protein